MRNIPICALIIAVVAILYYPATQCPFVNYDDTTYVSQNAHIRTGLTWSTIGWAFISFQNSNWHPLTWVSHALDVELFGLQPSGHHLGNVVLHAVNSAALFLLAFYSTRRTGPSLVLALLFAVHPLNVESVAWVAERKNVLSTFFFLLTLGAYGWYARRPSRLRNGLVILLFACGLMSKPMLVTLPFVLLLLDYWPLARMEKKANIPKLLIEKIPLFVLSVASCVVTVLAQRSGRAMGSVAHLPLTIRVENAILAYGLYLWKMLWPAKLAVFYPHPGASPGAAKVAASIVALAVITGLVFVLRRKKYLLTGWLWFLGTLVPVIGIVQVGDQAMADRYAYIPLIGLFVMGTWEAADVFQSRTIPRAVPVAVSAGVLIALSAVTNRQLEYWSSDAELWTHALSVTTNNSLAHEKLGWNLMTSGELDEALPHLRAAAAISPNDPLNHINLGLCLDANHDRNAAIEEFKKAISVTSDPEPLAMAYADLGVAYDESENDLAALQNYDRALQLNPKIPVIYLNRALLLEREGKLEQAVSDYRQSVELQPSAKAYAGLSRALQKLGRESEAQASYQKALQLTSGPASQ